MICPKCNAENYDTNLFCNECGEKLSSSTVEDAVYEEPVSEVLVEEEKPSAVAIVKKIASSKVFTLAAVGNTLAFAATVIAALYSVVNFIITAPDLFQYLGDSYLSEIAINTISTNLGTVIGNFMVLPITLIPLIALWLIVKAGKREGNEMKTGGLMTMKVMQIISLVGLILAGVMGVIGVLFMFIGGGALAIGGLSDMSGEGAALLGGGVAAIISGVLLFIVLIATYAFTIVQSIFTIKSLSTAINTCRTGKASAKVSVFVAVMCFISAALVVFNPVVAIISNVTLLIGSFTLTTLISVLVNILVSLISTTGTVMASVCFGITIFKYRSAMKKHIEKYGE